MPTIWDVGFDIFMVAWSVLDVMFTAIENWFIAVFKYIPKSAIPFLMGICLYSVMMILKWAIGRIHDAQWQRLILQIVLVIYTIFMILLTVWRLGFIALIEDKISVPTIGEFLYNVLYIIFGIILIVVFIKKVPYLQEALLVFLWFGFTLFTFVIGPITGEISLQEHGFETLVTFVLIGGLFSVPRAAYQYQENQDKQQIRKKGSE